MSRTFFDVFTKMTLEKSTLSIPAILIVLNYAIISIGHEEITCPEVVTIEKGGTGIVSCDNSGKRVVLAYWYIGDPATTRPILRLENGNPGGTLYGNGHYNISTSGAMIITNATIKHEAIYANLIYYHDDTDERKHIKVNITISPLPSCPVINVCNSCEDCTLAVNYSGKLRCSLNSVRPMVPIRWIFKAQHGVSIVEHPPTVINDLPSGTWSTSVEISYAVPSCSQETKFQCEAQDNFNLLGKSKSTVKIYTANCTEDSPGFIGTATKKALIIVIVCIGIISSVGFITYLFIDQYSTDEIRRQGCNPSSYTKISASCKIVEEEAMEFLSSLKKHYKATCAKKYLTFANGMDVEDLYAACDCDITDSNGDKSSSFTDRLLTCKTTKDEKLVIVTGGPRHWETLFVEHFVHQWIHEEISDSILLPIGMKDVKINRTLIDVIKADTEDPSTSIELLTKILNNKKCILLLYGITNAIFDDIASDEDDFKRTETIEGKSFLALTFSELFKELRERRRPHVHVWISTRNTNNLQGVFSEPFAKVYISHVNVKQLVAFIQRVYEQCTCLPEQAPCEKSPNNTEVIADETINEYERGKDDNSTSKHLIEEKNDNQESTRLLSTGKVVDIKDSFKQEEKIHCITNYFEQSQFCGEFKDTPMLLSIMVHAVIKKYCSQPTDFDEVKTLTTEGIVCTVINYFKEVHKLENHITSPSMFHTTLGKLAIYLIDKQRDVVKMESDIVRNCGEDFNFAMEKGILQYSNKLTETHVLECCTEPAPRYVEFSHRYLKHYFAAYYFIQSKCYYTEAVANYEKSRNFPVFRFIIHLEEMNIKDVLHHFWKFNKDDDVIACLYKWDNHESVKKVITELQGKELKVNSLVKNRDAFKSFFEKCVKMKIDMKSLFVGGNLPLSFMTFEMPYLEELTFYDIEIKEEVLLRILKWLSKKNITLRFIKCGLPDTLSNNFKTEIKTVNDIGVKTIRQDDDSRSTIFTLNYSTAKWTKTRN